MKLEEVGEFGLIELIRKGTPRLRGVRIGIGDDAAWITTRQDSLLFTSDLLIEGVHFNLAWTSMQELGHKALTASLSDIAAMGGTPAYFLISLALPDITTGQVEALYRGVRRAASEHRVALVGGDTCAADRLVIDVFMAGYAPYGAVARSGASVKDDIYVTGTLGDSALGLALLTGSSHKASARDRAYLVRRHHRPTARVSTGQQLARKRLATAMMDISDGLLQDLGHICRASHTGAVLHQEHLPLSPPYKRVTGGNGVSHALSGGEDYELLFTARPRHRKGVEQVARRTGIPITRIGQCVPEKQGLTLVNEQGASIPITRTGHDHFKGEFEPPLPRRTKRPAASAAGKRRQT